MLLTQLNNNIFTIDHFFTPEQCDEWINRSEAMGYTEATVRLQRADVMRKNIRNNQRLIYEDKILAESLWEQLKAYVPVSTAIGLAIGLNERFRFYKYQEGQTFQWHKDGSFFRNINEWSVYTFLIYLNDDMLGGETAFENLLIRPQTGKALIFKHDLLHKGNTVTQGTKYVLRTDIMYRRK